MKKGRKGKRRKMKREGAVAIRASISFGPDIYESLKQIARKKKVSLAWVVRDAVDRYVAEKEDGLERE